MMLLRVDGAIPVCCVNFSLSFAIAAAASGNIWFMTAGSSCDSRLFPPGAPGEGGGRPMPPMELRDPGIVSLLVALSKFWDTESLMRSVTARAKHSGLSLTFWRELGR